MAAQEPQWRALLNARMHLLRLVSRVLAGRGALDGWFGERRSRLEALALMLMGTDGAISPCRSLRVDIYVTYNGLGLLLARFADHVHEMRRIEQRALVERSHDPAAPLASVDELQGLGLDEATCWAALVRLQAATAHGEAATALVHSARVAVRAVGRLLAAQPRSHDVRARIARTRRYAVGSLRAGHALAVVSLRDVEAAYSILVPVEFGAIPW
jgi:hypothetical protein